VIDTPAQIKLVEEIFKNTNLCKVKVLASLTKGLEGDSLSPMMELKQAGAKGLTNCLNPIKNSLVLRRAMEYASGQDITIFYQPQNNYLANNGCVHEGKISNKLGLPGIPSAAESVAVAEAILLSKLTDSRLHLCRISCLESLTLIKNAQSEGLHITSDVAIHQLYFDENAIDNFNSDFHVMPPFRTNEDLISLQQAISKDTITAICSDHQPHNEDAKQAPFSDTQPGISSIEILIPLLMELVGLKLIDLNEAIAKVTSNPSKILGIEAGLIEKGLPADLCIIKKEDWIFDEKKIISAGKNNPFIGRKFNYLVDKTICDGKIVYDKK
ncbi:amidohydrolase family protein, partial [Gammaproteobacteria bacterium]|nr:amidohydrolase family protein [Gammaproteobacteria bacterium]